MAAKTATAVKKPVKELSEEEILKAPEKDYMNEAQLAFFKKRLMEVRDQILRNADDTGEHLRENEITTDPSDRATLEEEYTLELRTRDRQRTLRKKVEKSIKLIDDGSYGYCEETGEPIGIPRLLARPTETLSLEAQERSERVQKLYGDDCRRQTRSDERPVPCPGELVCLETERRPVRPAAGHEEQHRDRQHDIGSGREERDAPRLVLLLVCCGLHAENLLLIGPDQSPDIYEHDRPEPCAHAYPGHPFRQRERGNEQIAEDRRAGEPRHDGRPAKIQKRARRHVFRDPPRGTARGRRPP